MGEGTCAVCYGHQIATPVANQMELTGSPDWDTLFHVMVGQWIRPWPGEYIVGEVMSISGEWLICRAAGGVTFKVRLADVDSGRTPLLRALQARAVRGSRVRHMERTMLGYRLTPKALEALTA